MLRQCLISFITFQSIVATIKKKEYNFLDQRKMDFDQDYEEFCKQTNDLHVSCIIKFLLTAVCLFFPFCMMLLLIINHSEGRGGFIIEVTDRNLSLHFVISH